MKKGGFLLRTSRNDEQSREYYLLDNGTLAWFDKPRGSKLGELDATAAKYRGLGLIYFEVVTSEGKRHILCGRSQDESRQWLEALRNATTAPVPSVRVSASTPPPKHTRQSLPMPPRSPRSPRESGGGADSRSPRSSRETLSTEPQPTRSPRLSMFGKMSPRSSVHSDHSPRLTGSRVKSGLYRALKSPRSSAGESLSQSDPGSLPTVRNSRSVSATEHYGWMSKKGKDRWFLLRDRMLYWFTKEQPLDTDFRKEVRGSLPLENCSVAPQPDFSFSITSPGGDVYVLGCQSDRERDDWIKAVQCALEEISLLVQSRGMHSGWLEKKRQRRFFKLQEDTLAWYAKESDVRERGQIKLDGFNVEVAVGDATTFIVFSVKDEQLRYELTAKSGEEAQAWIKALRLACERQAAKAAEILKARATARENAAKRGGGPVAVEKKGWFTKKRKKRYFVLRNTVLMWYASEHDTTLKGSLEMQDCVATARGFDLHIRTKEGVVYVLTAHTKQMVDEWVSVIKDACAAASQEKRPATRRAADAEPKRGWAVKKGKRRYLLLKPGELLYFDKEQSGSGEQYSDKPKGSIRLATASVNEVSSGSFLIRTEGSTDGLVFEASDSRAWVDAIDAFISLAKADSGLSHSGWMVKKGKRRWFALNKKGTLMWFNDVQAEVIVEQANGSLTLKRCRIVDEARTITITPHAETGEKPLEVTCYNAAECSAWLGALRGGQADASMQTAMVDPFASSGNGLVFGRPLEEVLEREGTTVPAIVTSCCEFLRETAMDHSGLFRLSGASSTINNLRDAFDRGEVVDFREGAEDEIELDSVAGLLKLYIRQLPEPPLTFDFYQDFLTANTDVDALSALIAELPEAHYNFCHYMLAFMSDIAALSDRNQMTPSNIAIVMGPNFLRQREGEGDLVSGLKDTPIMLAVFRTLVEKYDVIFG